jgi:hypothetical protein
MGQFCCTRATLNLRETHRSVRDAVARAGAAALEGVVETEPVADLVSEGAAAVVARSRAARDGRVAEDNTVVLRRARVRAREGSVSNRKRGQVSEGAR